MRVTHLSIIHPPLDTRIFHKQCVALAGAGYEVHLLTSGTETPVVAGVHLHSVSADAARPPARRQWGRFARAARRALSLRPSVFHLHEPHLIPLGVVLALAGSTVIYDVHEDYAAHARTKLVAHPLRGRLKALMWRALEAVARRTLAGFVCASARVATAFPADRTVVVGNFPLHREFDPARYNGSLVPYGERGPIAIYVGMVSEIRAFWEMARAVERLPRELDCRLRIVGSFRSAELERAAAMQAEEGRIELTEWRSRQALVPELLSARMGLILLHPLPNHMDAARSNKLFEYMAAGLPVIAPDFPSWRRIVCGVGCGLVVDPCDPAAIAAAIEQLLRDPAEARAMGERGRAAVRERFNWETDRARLLSFYRRLAGSPAVDPAPAADDVYSGRGAAVCETGAHGGGAA